MPMVNYASKTIKEKVQKQIIHLILPAFLSNAMYFIITLHPSLDIKHDIFSVLHSIDHTDISHLVAISIIRFPVMVTWFCAYYFS